MGRWSVEAFLRGFSLSLSEEQSPPWRGRRAEGRPPAGSSRFSLRGKPGTPEPAAGGEAVREGGSSWPFQEESGLYSKWTRTRRKGDP